MFGYVCLVLVTYLKFWLGVVQLVIGKVGDVWFGWVNLARLG